MIGDHRPLRAPYPVFSFVPAMALLPPRQPARDRNSAMMKERFDSENIRHYLIFSNS
jgi:hypothetical protein